MENCPETPLVPLVGRGVLLTYYYNPFGYLLHPPRTQGENSASRRAADLCHMHSASLLEAANEVNVMDAK